MPIFKTLNKPYPHEESIKKKIFIAALFGVFIGLFLLILKPFDIQNLTHKHKTIFLLGYGFITFLSMLITFVIFPVIFKKFHNKEKWTTGKEIIHITTTLFLIALLNIPYSAVFCNYCPPFETETYAGALIFSMMSVFILGIFPVSIMVLVYQNILLKRNIKNAEIATQKIKKRSTPQETISIYSNNKRNMLSININQLLVIEANGNYINVYYEENDKLIKEMIRNTLKNTEDITEKHSNIIRCHKSYIVNLSKLKKVTGNAQGYKLTFNHLSFTVPVSRNLSKKILNQIQN